MKANDLRPGVVYAYGTGNLGRDDEFDAVVLLDTDRLYELNTGHGPTVKVSAETSPHGEKGRNGTVGYLAFAVSGPAATPSVITSMRTFADPQKRDSAVRDTLTLEPFALVYGSLPGTRVFPVIVNHRMIRGQWDEFIGDRNAKRAERAQRRAEAQAIADEELGRLREAHDDTLMALGRLGVIATIDSDGGYSLNQAEADRLIERLRSIR